MKQTVASSQGNNNSKVRTVGVVGYDGVELLDLTGPLDVFAMANALLLAAGIVDEVAYKMAVIAKKEGVVTSSSGLRIVVDQAYVDVSDGIDTLVIPGSPSVDAVLADPQLRDWIRLMAPRVRRIVSVCTGAFLLADAGLLDGHCAH